MVEGLASGGAFVDAVYERFGRVDALVNNAGINPARFSPQDMTLEFWRKVFSASTRCVTTARTFMSWNSTVRRRASVRISW